MKMLVVMFATLSTFACAGGSAPAPAEQPKPTEIPITSKSPKAVDQFKKGRDLTENLRMPEAAEALDEAIKLDPDFAQALAYRGVATPGPEGLKQMERASVASAELPKAEKLLIDATLAGRRGEFAKSTELWTELTEAVPSDWRSWTGLGTQLYSNEKYREAADAFKKAAELNPKAGSAFNNLGYAYLAQGEAGPAIEAFQKYVSINPDEPNPQDSLAEALMAGGQFAEAEAAFRKAVALSPAFSVAWEGVAYTKAFRGDWAGAREALNQARDRAPRPSDRIDVQRLGAWVALAEGNMTEGMKQLDALEQSPDASPVDAAFVATHRATALVDASRYANAETEIAKALQTADAGTLPPAASRNLRRIALMLRAAAQGRSGTAAAVDKTVAALQQDATARPDEAQLQSTVHFAQGMLAVAQKDLKAAKAHFDLCSSRDTYCHWQAFVVAQKGGDRAGADAARARVVRVYGRDPLDLYVRSALNRMTPKSTN
jgi:Flp pilus assembly protein TadD